MFSKDLEFGKKYELETLKYLEYKEYKISDGCFKEYDILIRKNNNKKVRIEVKADRLAHKTNNLCIEFMSNNKSSGIETTTSHYYYIYEIIDDNEYILYKIKTSLLKNMIINKKYNKILSGGDNSKFYLFNKYLFIKNIINK